MYILLDTSELKAKSRDDSSIKSLQRLAQSGQIHLLLPYMVEMEYKTQATGFYSKPFGEIQLKLQEIAKGDTKISKKINSHIKSHVEFAKKIHEEAELDADKFLSSFKPIRLKLNLKQAEAAMASYFNGSAPYKKIKSREDIPDAFILESVRSYLEQNKTVIYIVTRDKKLSESFSVLGKDKVMLFQDSDELIKHQDFQAKFANEFVQKNLYSIDQSLKANLGKLKSSLRSEIELKLPFETFSRSEDYFDVDDVIITGVNDIDEDSIEFSFDNVTDYGGGEIVLPFHMVVDVLGEYYVNKADYHSRREVGLSIRSQNDHVYEVEDEFSVKVSGLLTIDIDTPVNGKGSFKASMVNYNDAKIDSSFEIINIE